MVSDLTPQTYVTTDTLDGHFVDIPPAAEERKPAAQKPLEKAWRCFMREAIVIEEQFKWLRPWVPPGSASTQNNALC